VTKNQNTPSAELLPNEIVRLRDGKKFFGFGPTALAEKIKNGEVPTPVKLGLRARGWTDAQIIAWQKNLVAAD
jgi:predicted DNA-binding transcriptional regulator AlpA